MKYSSDKLIINNLNFPFANSIVIKVWLYKTFIEKCYLIYKI